MVNAKLVVVGGNTAEDEIPLHLPVVLGRGVEVDLAVPDELVSRRHAEIFELDGRLFVKDLGSKNGTFVNNLRIVDREPLDPDQLLTLGTITFRAIYSVNGQPEDRASDNGSQPQEKSNQAETIRVGIQPTETLAMKTEQIRTVESGSESANTYSKETVSLDEYVKQNRNDSAISENNSRRETVYATVSNTLENGHVSAGHIPAKHVPK